MANFLAVALEGDLRDRLEGIVRASGKEPIGEVRFFTDWGSVAPYVNQNGYLGAAYSGAWTVLVDGGSVTGAIFDDLHLGMSIAAEHATRVVSAYGNSVCGMYGFRVHSTSGTRAVLVDEGRVVEDEGEPIPGEDPVILYEYNEHSVLYALELLGIDIAEGVESCTQSALLRFMDITE